MGILKKTKAWALKEVKFSKHDLINFQVVDCSCYADCKSCDETFLLIRSAVHRLHIPCHGPGLTTSQKIRHDVLWSYRFQVKALQEKTYALINACKSEGHVIRKYHSSAQCVVCNEDLGWWCPKSDTHVCEYHESEICIHCGEPSERK